MSMSKHKISSDQILWSGIVLNILELNKDISKHDVTIFLTYFS